MEQLRGVNNSGSTPQMPSQNGAKSSQSRGNLQVMPELEYDPWYANQQRYLAHQGAALNKQANIYQKHMNEFTLRKQELEDQQKQIDREREEQQRVRAA